MDNPIAIQIKTFNRPERLVPTLESIHRWCNVPYRLYIGDDGPLTPELAGLYDGLESDGHEVIRFPRRLNVTTARNLMLDRLRDEAFVLRLDDDFNFSSDTNICNMLAVLAARPEIGAISDLELQFGGDGDERRDGISDKQGHVVLRDGVLHKLNIPPDTWVYHHAGGVRFAYANFTRNFLLIRREVFARVKWQEELVIQGEHSAFMLDLQNAGWALAFTPDSIHIHNEGPLPAAARPDYAAARRSTDGRDSQKAVFLQCYGVSQMRSHHVGDLLSAPWSLRLRKVLGWRAGARRHDPGKTGAAP